jgi:hypothetical protein
MRKIRMDLLRYLDTSFFTQDQLLAASGIDAAELATLVRRAVMPKPSYRLRLDIVCDSFFGPHAKHRRVDYYAKDYASWIGIVRSLPGDADARRVFEQRYRARLAQLAAGGISSDDPKLNADLSAHLDDEWRHFLDGTYGLCTKSGLPEDIASKEVAIAIVKQLAGETGEQALTAAERACLAQAVDLLDAASAQFAPHERERSSRHRLVDQVRKSYRLHTVLP